MLRTFPLAMTALALALAAPSLGHAQIVNGNFETGDLTGWTAITTSVTSVTQTPAPPFDAYGNGSFQAVLTAGNATAAEIAGALGVNTTDLDFLIDLGDNTADPAFNGLVITQSFTLASAGDLSFNWGFNSNENLGDAFFRDAAFIYFDGTLTLLANTRDTDDSVAYQTFSLLGVGSGNHTIAFGVLNGSDASFDSGLMVDNFTFAPAAVPEPATMALAAIGGVGAYFGRRKVRQRRLLKRYAAK